MSQNYNSTPVQVVISCSISEIFQLPSSDISQLSKQLSLKWMAIL